MAIHILPARSTDYAVVIAYSAADAQLSITDEPVLAWAVDDATGVETPVIIGHLPAPATTPDITKPTFVNTLRSMTEPGTGLVVTIAPNAWRGSFDGFLDWIAQDLSRSLHANNLISPAMRASWDVWASANPQNTW